MQQYLAKRSTLYISRFSCTTIADRGRIFYSGYFIPEIGRLFQILVTPTFSVLPNTKIGFSHLPYMSSSDNPPQDNTPSRSGRRNSERDSDGQRSSSSNIIEFINSQDPNVRSAIQRHTAYHSAAQRREARSRLLRRSSQTRYLEWTRRPRTETDFATSSASSASSVSMSPAPSLPERPGQPTRASSNEQESSMPADVAALESARVSQSPTAHVWASDDDNAVLEFCKYSLTRYV